MKVAWIMAAALMAMQPFATGAQTGERAAALPGKSTEPYSGEVRRISRDTGRVTLAHGPLTGFNMPAMTMSFAVKDPQQLAAIREGDKVKFALEKSGDNLVVTHIVAVR